MSAVIHPVPRDLDANQCVRPCAEPGHIKKVPVPACAEACIRQVLAECISDKTCRQPVIQGTVLTGPDRPRRSIETSRTGARPQCLRCGLHSVAMLASGTSRDWAGSHRSVARAEPRFAAGHKSGRRRQPCPRPACPVPPGCGLMTTKPLFIRPATVSTVSPIRSSAAARLGVSKARSTRWPQGLCRRHAARSHACGVVVWGWGGTRMLRTDPISSSPSVLRTSTSPA